MESHGPLEADPGAPSLQMGYLKKLCDGSLLYSVVNAAEPDAEGECPAGTQSTCGDGDTDACTPVKGGMRSFLFPVA